MDKTVELVIDPRMNIKGERMIRAMYAAAKSIFRSTRLSNKYTGNSQFLVIYGMGSEANMQRVAAHRKAGGTVVAFDLGYYGRSTLPEYPMRLTINREHPVGLLSSNPEPSRWDSSNIELRNDYNPAGHILLCGMGRKSRFQYAIEGNQWENQALQKLRNAYPGIPIRYRAKAGAKEKISCTPDTSPSIEAALKGARMVVVRHSNVAVDACIAGVPVVCDDGAATYLYGSDVCNPKNPSEQERLRFLRALAWWQWMPHESPACWQHILSVLT